MKTYRAIAVSRMYYSIDIEARDKEHAALILSQMKKFDLKFEKTDDLEILENSLHQINNEKPTDV